GVDVSMPFFGEHPQRRADHAAHGRLKETRRRLVEGADDHRRQKSVDLLVDHVYRQSVTIRYTVRVSASVFESPRAPVEVHRYRTLVTERAVLQYLVSARHLVVVGIRLARLGVLEDAIGGRTLPNEEPK